MYEQVTPESELRQGDIFDLLPWPLFDPCEIGAKGGKVDLSTSGFSETFLGGIYIEPGPGVIVSADCDCEDNRTKFLHVCRLRPITEAEPGYHNKALKGQLDTRIRYQRKKQGLFFFPKVGHLEPMYSNLNEIYPIRRDFLVKYKHKRVGSLIEEARHHLREKIGAYHTRFGPDERYMFTAEEMIIVEKEKLLSRDV